MFIILRVISGEKFKIAKVINKYNPLIHMRLLKMINIIMWSLAIQVIQENIQMQFGDTIQKINIGLFYLIIILQENIQQGDLLHPALYITNNYIYLVVPI